MANRTFMIASGAVVGVIGALVAAGGAAVVIIFGSNGSITTGAHQVTTRTTALVTPIDDLVGMRDLDPVIGRPQLELEMRNPAQPVFVGVARTADAERYLAGAEVDRVDDVDVDPFRLTVTHRPGSARPTAPGSEAFWVAQASGTAPSITWRLDDGAYSVVVMDAHAAAGVTVTVRASMHIPHLFALGAGALVLGAVGLAGGGLLFVLGLRRPTDSPADPRPEAAVTAAAR